MKQSMTLARRRRGSVMGPGLAAGLLMALSLPPFGWWPLAMVGAGVLWWRLQGLSRAPSFRAGLATGLGCMVPGLWWSLSFNGAGGLVLMVVESLFVAVGCLVVPSGRGRAPALTGVMVLVELARDNWPFGGLPIGSLALGQAGGPLLVSARIGGGQAMVALTWAGGIGAAMVALSIHRGIAGLRARRHKPVGWGDLARHKQATDEHGAPVTLPKGYAPPTSRPLSEIDGAGLGSVARSSHVKRRPALSLAFSGVLTLAITCGVVGLAAVSSDGGGGRTVRVAAIQGGGPRGLRTSETNQAAAYAAQISATDELDQADGGRAPTLIVWPEDTVSLDAPLDQSPNTESTLADIAVSTNATLLVGVTADVSSTQFRNQVVAFNPAGSIEGTYEKVHRVPFGEYVPWRQLFSDLANLSGVPRDAIAGRGNGEMETSDGPVGIMVSYEVFYQDRARSTVNGGAQLLVVPTNTSSYTTSQVPTQELAAAKIDAVSEGRDLLQASPTGFSAAIDNHGKVLAVSHLGQRQDIVTDLIRRTGSTLYERLGDWLMIALSVILLISGWMVAIMFPNPLEISEAPRLKRTFRAGLDSRARSEDPVIVPAVEVPIPAPTTAPRTDAVHDPPADPG